jgi:hypothetical protein
MKAFIAAILVIGLISTASAFILNGSFQQNADEAFATSGARVERVK